MAFATIQITQGVSVGGNGESILGFDPSVVVTLTDAGGAGATSYLWEIISFPGPLAAPPTITNSTSQVATVTPVTDGIYVVRLTRDDPGDGVSTMVRFFGVKDDDGFHIPSAGMTGNMSNVGGSAAAQAAGWMGRVSGSTNTLLDAIVRRFRARIGRYFGKKETVSHSSSSPATETVVDGTNKPYRILTLTGTGAFTSELSLANVEEGKVFRYQVALSSGAGSFTLNSGIAGTTILTLTAPPSGTFTYTFEAYYDGTAWVVASLRVVDAKAIIKKAELPLVAGLQDNDTATFKRIGAVQVDPSLFPSNIQVKFEGIIETTTNTVELRLFNVTDAAVVSGSTLSSTSTSADAQEATVTLPSALKLYEAQLRITPVGGPGDTATCTGAKLVLTWA